MRRATQHDERYIRNDRIWQGETLCVKKFATGDEKPFFGPYSKFGVLLNTKLPITVYLRDESMASQDFIRFITYQTHDAMMDDGWVVD